MQRSCVDGVFRSLVHMALQLWLSLVISAGCRRGLGSSALVQTSNVFALISDNYACSVKPLVGLFIRSAGKAELTCSTCKRDERRQSARKGSASLVLTVGRARATVGPEVQFSRRRRAARDSRDLAHSMTPPSPTRSPSPVEATLIDALPESPTAAVPVRSEIATGDDAPVAAAAALDDSLCSGVVVAVPAAPAVSALVGRAPESSPWFVRRRGVIIDVPEGAVAGSRAIVSLPDDGSARHATVTIAFPPGLSTGQELTVALEV